MEMREKSRFSRFDDVEIMCPYCFKEFHHDEVGFRAKAISAETKRKWQEALKEKMGKDDSAGANYFKKKLELAEKFAEQPDEIFLDYWKKMGWEASIDQLYEIGDGYTEYNNGEARSISKIKDPVIGIDGYGLIGNKIKDESGFVTKAVDIRGEEEGTSDKRVCPYCHNILPKNYGRNPVKFISVVGVSGAGKTVMLSRLLDGINKLLQNVGYTAIKPVKFTADSYVRQYKIEQDKPLPMGTNKTQFKPPIFLDIKRNNRVTTIVLYDIAGENCIDPERLDFIGPFVRHSDGIIMLLDPEQIESFDLSERANKGAGNAVDPIAVLSAMASAFLLEDNQHSDVPIAVTFSKSDLFRIAKVDGSNVVNENSNIFKTFKYKNNSFMIDEYRNIDGEVRQIVSKHCKELLTSIGAHFENFGFFAISTLGHDTEKDDDDRYVLQMNIEETRIEEPLMWLLFQWNMINSYTERNGQNTSLGERLRNLFGGR